MPASIEHREYFDEKKIVFHLRNVHRKYYFLLSQNGKIFGRNF